MLGSGRITLAETGDGDVECSAWVDVVTAGMDALAASGAGDVELCT